MRQTSLLVSLFLLVTSCETMDPRLKEKVGTALGAAGGGAIGASLAKGDDRIWAGLLGAAVGGFVGNRIGAYLDERDREKLARSTERALSTGEDQEFSSSSGVQGKVSVRETRSLSREVEIPVLKGRVREVPPIELIGEEYLADSGVNVRGGPGTDYEVVERLGIGSRVNVVGKVESQDWFLISKDGAGSGFVYAKLLRPAPVADAPPVAAPPAAQLDRVATARVQATTECRVVTQEITRTDGKTVSEDVRACRGPDGWKIMS